jgi:nucleotide-binding universal stress UspA family protein
MSSIAQTPVTPALTNILFATDFSVCSQAALPYVRAVAERYSSTVHVVHVLAPEPTYEFGVPLDNFPELDADLDVAKAAMKTLLAGKPFGKVAHTTTVIRGYLWGVFAAVIEEKGVDLIVLGTHGRRGLKKLVLGSVAEEVYRLATCPVLTVGPQATANASFATILFATDLSFGLQQALTYAVSLARAYGSHLVLMHALPACMEASEGGITEFLADTGRRVAALLSAQVVEELKPEIVVACGPAAETILSIAKSKQADLIVMGAHHSAVPSVAAHMLGATAPTVVCQAHCPVLTVRS